MVELIAWSLLGAAWWWWLLRRTPRGLGGRAPVGQWHGGDGIFAASLALYFIFNLATDDGKPSPINVEIIKNGTLGYLLIIALFSTLAFARGQSPQEAFGLVPPRPLRVVGIGVACIVMTYPFVQLAEQVAVRFGRSVSDGDEMVQFLLGKTSSMDVVWIVVLAVVVAPLTEELVFRGYLYGVMKKYVGLVGSMLTCSLLFGAVHHNLPAMPAYFILGLGLTLAYEITGSLWAPIVMHMLFNLAPVVVILCFPEWIPKT